MPLLKVEDGNSARHVLLDQAVSLFTLAELLPLKVIFRDIPEDDHGTDGGAGCVVDGGAAFGDEPLPSLLRKEHGRRFVVYEPSSVQHLKERALFLYGNGERGATEDLFQGVPDGFAILPSGKSLCDAVDVRDQTRRIGADDPVDDGMESR